MKEIKNTLLVFLELPKGIIDETGKGLLSYTSRLANIIGADWRAATCSDLDSQALEIFGKYGTPSATKLSGGENIFDRPADIGSLIARFAHDQKIDIIVLPQNDLGASLAPVVAAELDAAILTEVTAVSLDENQIRLSRSTLGKRIAETRIWKRNHPLVITVPLSSLSTVLLPTNVRTKLILQEWRADISRPGTTPVVVERTPPDPKTVDLSEAEVIFCIGKGCDREVFEMLEKLSSLLNVSLGVTRPVYDMGWTGFERMIGQTGKTVVPQLYLAFGVSGSMHHIGGIKDSRRIISLNVDARAPIFPNSDEGFVADVNEVLPLLLEKAEKMTRGAL